MAKMRLLLTPLHEGDSRNPASCVSGRHIADLRDQLGRPSRRVRPGWCLSTKTVQQRWIPGRRCWRCRYIGSCGKKELSNSGQQQTVGMEEISRLISRRRRSAGSAVLRFGVARGEKLPRELVSERPPGTSRVLSMSVPLSVVLMLSDRKERGEKNCMYSEGNGLKERGLYRFFGEKM